MLENNNRNARFLARMGAQGTYGQAIFDLAEDDNDFFAVSADLGVASGLDRLKKLWRKICQCRNCGTEHDFNCCGAS